MVSQKGFLFDHRKCIGCGACEIACKLWNDVEVGPRWRRVVTVEEGRYPQIRAINVSFPCLHCGNPLCLEACPLKAVSKRPEDGLVVVDRRKCI
ncbi:MAG: 4Fe-4S dicluster domain-containing protein, partial [Chloroflexi bacterium]|nr:4Fe-4S dicluster domain-containing protein [Chloroflexota bacterium]